MRSQLRLPQLSRLGGHVATLRNAVRAPRRRRPRLSVSKRRFHLGGDLVRDLARVQIRAVVVHKAPARVDQVEHHRAARARRRREARPLPRPSRRRVLRSALWRVLQHGGDASAPGAWAAAHGPRSGCCHGRMRLRGAARAEGRGVSD